MTIRRLGGIFVALLCLSGCFDTPRASIAFRCGQEGECPSGYECRDDGCCHLVGSTSSEECPMPADASVIDTAVPDASPPDAALPDAAPPDAAVPDAETPDAQAPDAAP